MRARRIERGSQGVIHRAACVGITSIAANSHDPSAQAKDDSGAVDIGRCGYDCCGTACIKPSPGSKVGRHRAAGLWERCLGDLRHQNDPANRSWKPDASTKKPYNRYFDRQGPHNHDDFTSLRSFHAHRGGRMGCIGQDLHRSAGGSTADAVPRASSTRKAKTRTMRAVAIAATHVISVEENARRILILAAFAFLALC